MPAHIHPAPQCSGRVGAVCATIGCSHKSCLNGGAMLECVRLTDGTYRCFHANYYVGDDVLPETPARPAASVTTPAAAPAATTASAAPAGPAAVSLPAVQFPAGITSNATIDRDLGEPIAEFAKRPGNGAFPNIPRAKVAQGMLQRIRDPSTIDQAWSGFCGPAAFLYSTLSNGDRHKDYVKFVIDLYETGQGTFGSMLVQPSQSFRMDKVPDDYSNAMVDWLVLGSLRDSKNWAFQYHRSEVPIFGIGWGPLKGTFVDEGVEELRAGTSTREMVSWFKDAGYTTVEDWTSAGSIGIGKLQYDMPANRMNAKLANDYYQRGYHICLSISANMLYEESMRQGGSVDHWVVLTSPMTLREDDVNFTIFTWHDGRYHVPQPARSGRSYKLTMNQFLKSYYGFIAFKP